MIAKRGTGDFPKVYRPCSPAEIYGQDQAKNVICRSLEKNTVSHTLLFHGPSGTGKTTCARIIGMGLLCERGVGPEPCGQCDQCRRIVQPDNVDFREINAADSKGIDFVRKLKNDFHYAPFHARKKFFVFDESHKLTDAAQNALLKEIEDINAVIYVIFCTTEPEKMIEPLRNRCMPIEFRLVEDAEIKRLLMDVCRVEGLNTAVDVIDGIIQAAKGRPRNALFELQKAVEAGALERSEKAQASTEQPTNKSADKPYLEIERTIEMNEKSKQTTDENLANSAATGGHNNNQPSDLSYKTGDTNRILLVAPHGHKDDEPGTAQIAVQAAEFLGCPAIVNTKVPKAKRNYNRIDQAAEDVKFIEAFADFASGDEPSLVVFLHGIEDYNIKCEAEKLGVEEGVLHAVVGYGQPDNLCASETTAKKLIKALSENMISAEAAFEVPDGYCAAHPNIMTQLFKTNEYDDPAKIEAIQIEFKSKGVRDTDSRTSTAINLARALSEATGVPLIKMAQKEYTANLPATAGENAGRLEPTKKANTEDASNEKDPEAILVDTAYEHLKNIFASASREIDNIEHTAMHRAGSYLIDTFYDGDFELAAKGQKTKKESFRALEERFNASDGTAPKKSWLHNAVKLAVDEHRFSKLDDKEAVHAYGQLGQSQKVLLLPLRPLDKEKVAKEVAGMTVAATVKRIDALKALKRAASAASKSKPTGQGEKADEERTQLKKSVEELADSIVKQQRQIIQQVAEIEKKQITLAMLSPPKSGFDEWTEKNVNICNGCLNGCLYCSAKSEAHRRGQIPKDQWVNQVVRPHDVSANQRFQPGWIGFPSTHDIIPEILDDYLEVLGKLLMAGNKVMIVSKPRLECIQEICAATRFFQDKVMFRFTIGAMSDDILRFWEPNAPAYAERRKSLQHASEAGYSTSVSAEPMLDADHAKDLVEDLAPLINGGLWIGKMNYMPSLDKVQDPGHKAELKRIKAGQSEESISKLYETLKDNPLVRWKNKTLPAMLAEDHMVRRTKGHRGEAIGTQEKQAAA